MVPYYGDFAEDDTVDMIFNAFSSDDPSASVTITNFINTDVHIHKDLGTTQRNNAAGITVSVDFDSITGNHAVKIDTSDNTVAGFYVTGSEYQVRIEGTTVDGATINAWIGSFSIERAGGVIALLSALTTELAKVPKSDAAVSWNATALAAIEGEVDDAIQTAKLDHLVQTAAAEDEVADNSIVARLAATEGDWSEYNDETDSLEAISVKQDTAQTDLDVVTGADGTTLATAQGNYAPNTVVPDVAGTAATPAEVATALTDIHLDHLFHATYDPASKPGAADALLNELIESDAGVSRYTANALEQAPSGVGGDATEAKQDQIIAAVITNAAGVDIAADIIEVKAETADIVADTNELQTDNIPGLIGALNDISTAQVNSEVDAALDSEMPAAPTADSLNERIMGLKYNLVNKMVVTEATGATVTYKDDDGTEYANVAAAFASAAGVTTRKRLE